MTLERKLTKAEQRARILAQRTQSPPSVETVDSVVDFAVRMLDKPLYPRQGLLLKLLTLDLDALTDYDRRVLDQWTSVLEQELDDEGRLYWTGDWGIPGDVLLRIEQCLADGAPWFREIVMVLGRRSGKGYMAAILFAWRVWKLLELGDPHQHYGIDPNKALVLFVFSVKFDQAKRDLFRDVRSTIERATCFGPFLGASTVDCVTILTPRQIGEGARPGIDRGLIEIRAGQTVSATPRGTTTLAVGFDEFGHVQGAGSTADSLEMYAAALPGTAQFGTDKLIVQVSSPWEQTGQLYASHRQALECDPDTGLPLRPTMLTVQLASWDLYEDFEIAHTIEMWPGGPRYPRQRRAQVAADDPELLHQRRLDPETFAQEYEAKFRTGRNAYLAPEVVAGIFAPWGTRPLVMRTSGTMGYEYVGHGDPARSGANFAFGIGHLEDVDGQAHTVYDVLRIWRPQDFPDGRINYIEVDEELFEICRQFRLTTVTFDQYNSAGSIDRLQDRLDRARLAWRTVVEERTATAEFNWRCAETFKIAAAQGLVHAPRHPEARRELEYLQLVSHNRVAAPPTGPVTTKDLADVMLNINFTLRETRTPTVVSRLRDVGVRGYRPPEPDPRHQAICDEFSAALRGSSRAQRNPARGINPQRDPRANRW